MRNLLVLIVVAIGLLGAPIAAQAPGMNPSDPLRIARVLVAKYPAQPIMSYIPALSWASAMRLAALTGEEQWLVKARREMQPFVDAKAPAIAEPYRLTSLAGHLALIEAAMLTGDKTVGALGDKAAAFILPQEPGELIRFATQWTDDMFMASAVLSRAGNGKHADAVGRLLTSYAAVLQRPDGLFNHAPDAPHAWGRGNGFALLGLTDALIYLPAKWADRAKVLEIYRIHLRALAKHQSDDGSWRQVIDDPSSYRELTVTAMTVAAIARGVSRGWIDRKTYEPIMNKGWQAVAARVHPDGTVRDVCSGTGAGPTKEYYLKRPVVNGADDRGGAMALMAAIEIATAQRATR